MNLLAISSSLEELPVPILVPLLLALSVLIIYTVVGAFCILLLGRSKGGIKIAAAGDGKLPLCEVVIESEQFHRVSGDLSVLSYNVYIRPPGVKANKSDFKDERLGQLLGLLPAFDVICLQEMFSSFSSRLDKFLAKSADHLPYYVTSAKPNWTYAVDGGLVIMSRLPIVAADRMAFKRGVTVDAIANKGAAFADILVGSDRLNPTHHLFVFNCHLQSDYAGVDNTPNRDCRIRQLGELNEWIQSKIGCFFGAADQPVILLCGDFNINGRCSVSVDSKEYLNLLESLQHSSWDIRDIMKESCGEHPVTYADAWEKDDVLVPAETVITCRNDLLARESLDYIFQIVPHQPSVAVPGYPSPDLPVSAPPAYTPLLEERETEIRVTEEVIVVDHQVTEEVDIATPQVPSRPRADVRPFFINDPSKSVTQCSDHYGVSVEVSVLSPGPQPVSQEPQPASKISLFSSLD